LSRQRSTQELGRQVPRLTADAGAGDAPIDGVRFGVAGRAHGLSDRRHEHAGPPPLQEFAGEQVGAPGTVVGEPDRHIDGHDADVAGLIDEHGETGCRQRRDLAGLVEGHAHPALGAAVDAEDSHRPYSTRPSGQVVG